MTALLVALGGLPGTGKTAAARALSSAVDAVHLPIDTIERRSRVRDRVADLPGLELPSRQQVLDRQYEPWDRVVLVVDTADRDVEACVTELRPVVEHARRLP